MAASTPTIDPRSHRLVRWEQESRQAVRGPEGAGRPQRGDRRGRPKREREVQRMLLVRWGTSGDVYCRNSAGAGNNYDIIIRVLN